jgi:hypothetical protein
MEIYLTDGGRQADGFVNEKLDCTVRALALARRISYKIAHQELEQAGRRSRHRFNFTLWLLSQSWVKSLRSNAFGTVRSWVTAHSDGNYIVQIRGHVFAVNHGMIMDSFKISPRMMVKNAWEIELAK